MKHLEGFDSILVASFIGGFVMYLLNKMNTTPMDNTTVIGYGAATGASVQFVMRMTGVS